MSENKCSYRIAYEKQKKRAERAEAERDAAKELAESRWVELEALLGEWNLCVKLSGSPTHGGLAGHVGRLRTQAAQTDAAQSTIAELRGQVERMREALAEAIESVEDWAGYASEYFRQKHGLKEELARFRATFGDAS